ncbi:MAG: hypothetical protein GQ469_04870, partial [Methanosarcinales archaeon]|nr:hypothetical protein [Methanosarcinales archaeon]
MVSISVKTETGKKRIFNDLSKEQCICLPITLILLMLSLTVPPASADYNYDGFPFTDQLDGVKQGIIKGGVYVDGGHGVG